MAGVWRKTFLETFDKILEKKKQLLGEEYEYVSLFHATVLFLYPLKTL